MANSSNSTADRSQVRSPNIRFRVFSQSNGECKHEFYIKLKDLTWDSLLKNLFGSRTFEENQLPIIVLLGDKHKIVLRHTNIKQLIRDALEESFKGFYVNLLIPDYEKFNSTAPSGAAQNMSSEEETAKMKAEINDFTEIFSKRINLPIMDQFVQSTPHVRFVRKDKDQPARVELPARENIPQLGELEVKRLNDGDLVNMLKDGASLIVKTSDDKMVSLKFYNDQLPTFNETRCAYKNLNLAYECTYLKVPVVIDDDIKFLFKRDAEFIQKMSQTMETAEKNHREHILRLRKFHQETMKKIKAVKDIPSTEPATPSTSGVTPSDSTAAPIETPAPPTNSPATKTPEPTAAVPPTSEGSSNEGTQPAGGRAIRRAHRSAHRKNNRCMPSASFAGLSSSAEGPYQSYPHFPAFPPPTFTDGIADALRNLHINPPRRDTSHHGCYKNCNAWRPFFVKPEPTTTAAAANAGQDASSEATSPIGEILQKFKSEVLQDVKALIKDVLDTSMPTPSTGETKAPRLSHRNDHLLACKPLDGSPSSAGKHKHHDRQHHGSGSSKKKSSSLCAATQLSLPEKILEIGNGLFIMSRNGFKVRMPRNTSLTIQLAVMKSSRCRIPLESTNLRLQLGGTSSIECCVTRANPPSGVRSSVIVSREHSVYHDIRIKSKDKSGRFRLYFNVTSGSAIIGRSFKIDVRVKKDFTMPLGGIDGALNYENETLPEGVVETKVTQTASAVSATVESQNSQAPQPNEEVSAAAAELADEGIGGNQEDDFSPTSDSEYSDVQDMLAKDEGIGRCYRTLVNEEPKETSTIKAGRRGSVVTDSESDTDSSISFLMDENEARDVLDDSLDVIQLPSCFIPSVELTDELLPVRIKRKSSSSAKGGPAPAPAAEAIENESSDSQQQQNVKPSAFDNSPLTPMVASLPDVTMSKFHIRVPSLPSDKVVGGAAPSDNFPPVTVSDDEEDEDVEFLPESIKWSEALEHAYHRSMYPNLKGLKETVRPATSEVHAAAPEFNPFTLPKSSSDSTPFKFTPKPSTSQTNPSYPPIIPEKLFDMFKNASVPIPKQMQDTVSSVFTSVSNEINNAANAARTAAASAAAAAANIVPNVPTPPSPAAENVSQDEAAASAQEARSSHSQPPEGKRSKNVSFSIAEPAPESSPFEFGQDQNQNQNQSENAAHIQSMYKNLSEKMQGDLITLHDMGFTDDPYMIYLLEQFPNDLSKVIESLVNYSTY